MAAIIPKRIKKGLSILPIAALFFVLSSVETGPAAAAEPWGTIMSVENKTNIRQKRSLDSHVVGSLLPGQRVKADLLRDGWYAVFEISETERSETKALGYVYAPRLFPSPKRTDARSHPKEMPAASGKPAPDAFSVTVQSIRCRVLPDGKEVLSVQFDRFYMPAVYALEGENPLIVMDVTRTSSLEEEWSEIRTDGVLIRRIRASLDPAARILRITLEMTPTKDYTVNPAFYPDKKVFALEVTAALAPVP